VFGFSDYPHMGIGMSSSQIAQKSVCWPPSPKPGVFYLTSTMTFCIPLVNCKTLFLTQSAGLALEVNASSTPAQAAGVLRSRSRGSRRKNLTEFGIFSLIPFLWQDRNGSHGVSSNSLCNRR
jgi:hypothetical protein